jgi:beta-phosphoglucomutase-like phosphatase (HAD superfamily)
MPKAAIFDLDGTLLDSVDLHALAWHEAMAKSATTSASSKPAARSAREATS